MKARKIKSNQSHCNLLLKCSKIKYCFVSIVVFLALKNDSAPLRMNWPELSYQFISFLLTVFDTSQMNLRGGC